MSLEGFYTKLKLNNKEKTLCEKHAGTRRHAYNWALALCKEKLSKKEKVPSAIDLHKLLVKDVKKENKWYYQVSKCAPQEGLRDLEEAFRRFWKIEHPKNLKKKYNERYHKKFLKQKAKGEIAELTFEHEKGFPKFKRKNVNESFYLEGKIVVEWNKIKVPKFGWLRTYEKMGFTEAKNVTISKRAGDWYISYKTKQEKTIDKSKRKGATGGDVGIKKLCTLADGKTFENSKAYKKNKKKLQNLQRKASRQYEDCKDNKDKNGFLIKSKNLVKTNLKLAKVHLRISNIRKDSTHKLTSYIVKNHDPVCIEDLNVSGMMKNHNLAGAIADGGFYEFKRQLIYKCGWYGAELIIADRFFASTKTCSCCGHKKEKMPLRQRIFECEKCSMKMDRDLNAAINLMNYAIRIIKSKQDAVSDTVKAYGESKFHDDVSQQVGLNEVGIGHQIQQNTVGQVWISS